MYRSAALTVLLVLAVLTSPAVSAPVPAGVQASMDKGGFKVYPGAVFCTGNEQIGIRLATADDPKKVQDWYAKQYTGWSIMSDFGVWFLYDGPQGKGLGDIMATKNIAVQVNKELPGWHSLPKNMTTEIVLAFPMKSE